MKTFTAVLELKNPSSPIFPKTGGAKENIKEKKRQIKKERKEKKRNFKVSCFPKLVLNKS